MGKKKKNGSQDNTSKILLATVLIQLIDTLMDFIKKLIE